jgi:hypothetical protein
MKLQEFIGKTVRDIVYDQYRHLIIWFTDNTKLLVDADLVDTSSVRLNINAISWKEELE